jgi:hypothetical protein
VGDRLADHAFALVPMRAIASEFVKTRAECRPAGRPNTIGFAASAY